MTTARAEVGAITVTVEAVLFDMDGTLVDSAASIDETWTAFADRHGVDHATVRALLPGRTAPDIVRGALPVTGPSTVAEEVAWVRRREATATAPVTAVGGAAALLSTLPAQQWAVVTAASGAMMAQRLATAGLPRPHAAVTADDDIAGKPEPDGYLRAARLLGADPARCLVLEDSTAGLLAGYRAGCFCVAVDQSHGTAKARVPDLRSITVTAAVPDLTLRIRR